MIKVLKQMQPHICRQALKGTPGTLAVAVFIKPRRESANTPDTRRSRHPSRGSIAATSTVSNLGCRWSWCSTTPVTQLITSPSSVS